MSKALADLVSIRGRFHRSVAMGADWGDSEALSQYVPTSSILQLTDTILRASLANGRDRCWSLTGPYGAGKSAFGLFLADVLCSRSPSHPASKAVRKTLGLAGKTFRPVFLTATRAPLAEQLSVALGESRPKRRGRPPKARAIGEDLIAAAQSAKQARKSGLLVVIDELGKFLEYAAASPGDGDVFVLQELAEAASRSDIPIILITILHSGFAEYLPVGEEGRRSEWRKVQGRYRDVPFQLPMDQMYELVASAIQRGTHKKLEAAWRTELSAVVDAEVFGDPAVHAAVQRHGFASFPLHPITLGLLWPLFRGKGSQNERSLFSFLTSFEPFGFQSFLSNTSQDADGYYRAAGLYDYITSTLGYAAFRGDQARMWTLVDDVLHRLGADAPPDTPAVVKTIGLLALFGGQASLRANKATIQLAVGPDVAVGDVLDYLQRRSFVVFRAHLDAYSLWEGSDFDLDAAYNKALEKARYQQVSASELRELLPPQPWISQRHYLRSGTLRYFAVDYVDASEIPQVLETETEADGLVLLVLPEKQADAFGQEAPHLGRVTRQEKPVIFARLSALGSLTGDLAELTAWTQLSASAPELAQDRVARKEVAARVASARKRVEEGLGPVLGLPGYYPDPKRVEWWYAGKRLSGVYSPEDLRDLLDDKLREHYPAAPILHNELINRSQLSSSAAAGRRNLLEAMLTGGSRKRLGIEGYPPELSMYLSILEAGGFHTHGADRWVWRLPPSDDSWGAVCGAIRASIDGADSVGVTVADLYRVLSGPPYGLREGPIPVVLLAFLLASGADIGLYEDGVLVPDLRIEAIERLTRVPGSFAIKSHRLSDSEQELIKALQKALEGTGPGRRAAQSLLPVVRQLVRRVTSLTPYARQTRRIQPADSASVRDLILQAADPSRLLFVDLPKVLDCSLSEGHGVAVFADRLVNRLHALEGVYDTLLDDIERCIVGTFGVAAIGTGAIVELRGRAATIQDLVAEPKLRVFVQEASREVESDVDWRERLGRSVRDGYPPSHWKDHDVMLFQARLREIGSDFARLEEIAAEQGRSGAQRVCRMSVVDGRRPEVKALIRLRDTHDPEVEEVVARMWAAIDLGAEESLDYRQVQLEALARIAERLMTNSVQTDAR